MSGEIIREESEICFRESARFLAEQIRKTIGEKGKAVFATAGGRSVTGVFTELVKEDIPWKDVHLFMVDERLVPLSDPDANFMLVKEHFLGNIPIPEENIHPFVLKEADDYGASEYGQELDKYGGTYDVLLLSAGEDGHMGALFPHHETFHAEAKRFAWTENSPKPPPRRMTMSKAHVLETKAAAIMLMGEGKKEALAKFTDESVRAEECPAKLVQQLPNWLAVTDIHEN